MGMCLPAIMFICMYARMYVCVCMDGFFLYDYMYVCKCMFSVCMNICMVGMCV